MLIIFSRDHSLVGLGIRALTASKWSHVDMMFADGTMIGATSKAGVERTTLETRQKEVSAMQVCRIVLPDEEKAQRFAEAQVGKRYDWGGCFGTVLRNSWQDEDKWFCSELVAQVCEEGGNRIISANHYVSRVTPDRVDWAPQLEVVDISQYTNGLR